MLGILCFALAVAPQDTSARSVPADTFADRGAAVMLANARQHRERVERRIVAYQATASQRFGVGLRALGRDRMIYHQEAASRIFWSRDSTSRIEVIGAREGIPIAKRGTQVPHGLRGIMTDLAFDPADNSLRLVSNDPEGFLSPLAPGAESDYRYASGDTSRITLQDGRDIQLVELKVLPRRSSFHLIAGSLWFDAATWGLVRMVFRPARPFDLDLDTDSSDHNDVPGFIKPIRAEIQYVTLEYALYDSRWWLPRVFAIDGEASAANLARTPVRFERVFTVERVVAGGEPTAASLRHWHPGGRRPMAADEDSAVALSPDSLAAIRKRCALELDSARQARRTERDSARGREEEDDLDMQDEGPEGMDWRGRRCVRRAIREAKGLSPQPDVVIVVPQDTAALLNAPELGPPILNIGDVISQNDLRDLGQAIGALPELPWRMKPQFHFGLPRYNRVEGLSLGVGANLDVGPLGASATVRLGVADLVPNAELSVVRRSRTVDWRLTAYRSLVTVDPPTRALAFGNSAQALLFGRDDGDYYRTLGIALSGAPGSAHAPWADWRIFAERQTDAPKQTDFSLAHVFDGAHVFRPDIPAATLNQAGARVTVRGFHTYATQLGLGAELMAEGQVGDARYAKSMVTLRGMVPLGPALLGLEGSAGTSAGPVPLQGLWYLGGPATLRGYAGGVMAGPAFWRGRAELANQFPGARLALFSDAGWAGARSALGTGTPLVSAGVGVSLLDGLFRIDVSRALRAPLGWRVDVYAGGVL